MKNFIQAGKVLTLTAPAAVTSGQLVKVGQIVGVAVTAAASGASVEVETQGVFTLPKAAVAVTAGAPLYYDPAAAKLTPTSAVGVTLVGVALEAAAIGDANVTARLDGTTRLAV